MASCISWFCWYLIITEPGISELNIYYIFPIIFCLGLSYVAITLDNYHNRTSLVNFFLFLLSITLLSFLTIPIGWVMPSLNHFIIVINWNFWWSCKFMVKSIL